MKKNFLTGLIILLPLAVTVMIVGFLVNFFTDPFFDVVCRFLSQSNLSPQLIKFLSKLLILVAIFFLIVLLGIITRWIVIRSLFNLGDKLLHKIPIVNTIYKATKEITKTIFTSDKNAFKQVVLVPFPRKDIYALGLISTDAPKVCSQTLGQQLVTVLIPTTPNPTAGFLLMYKREDLIFLDMKTEEAIKYIVSCGVLVPEPRRLG